MRLRWVASGVLAGLMAIAPVAAPAWGSPVAPAPPSPAPSDSVASAATATHEYTIGPAWLTTANRYGAAAPVARRIVIGQNTTTVQFDPGIPMAEDDFMECSGAGGVLPSLTFDADTWNAVAVHSFAVTPGAVTPGATYVWDCFEGGQRDERRIGWYIVAEANGPETLVLERDPDKQTLLIEDRDFNVTDREFREASPGDHVQIAAPPDTWARPGADIVPQVVLRPLGDSVYRIIEDVVISPNGDLLSFAIPVDLDPAFLNGKGYVQVTTSSTFAGSDTAPTRAYWSRWETGFIFPAAPRATSETSLHLDHPIGVSARHSKAFVTVRTATEPSTTGLACLYVDGKLVQCKRTDAAQSSTVQFTVPRLDRGRHVLYATFDQTQTHKGSRSENVVLRILI
jgi:hypothetical protein